MAQYNRPLSFVGLTSGLTGTLNYAVYDINHNVLIAPTTVGITEDGSSAIYSVIAAWDTSWSGYIRWSVSNVALAREEFESTEFTAGTISFSASSNLTLSAYMSNDVADQYFYQRLNSNVWLEASEQDKSAALIQSTRAIDNLNFLGVKFNQSQPFAFPRWQPNIYNEISSPVTPVVPQDILIACCENAIVLLDGFDFEIEIQALSNNATIFAGVRETYDRQLAVSHIRHGIASGVAWIYLKPWLADTLSLTLSRVN